MVPGRSRVCTLRRLAIPPSDVGRAAVAPRAACHPGLSSSGVARSRLVGAPLSVTIARTGVPRSRLVRPRVPVAISRPAAGAEKEQSSLTLPRPARLPLQRREILSGALTALLQRPAPRSPR